MIRWFDRHLILPGITVGGIGVAAVLVAAVLRVCGLHVATAVMLTGGALIAAGGALLICAVPFAVRDLNRDIRALHDHEREAP